MAQTKLILIEGIMGSGKSTTANFIADTLQLWDQPTELYLEGNLDHPADYDAVACVDETTMHRLCANEPDFAQIIEPYSTHVGDDWLISYGKLRAAMEGQSLSSASLDEIQKYDIYDGIALNKHRDLLLSRWAQFVQQQAARDVTTIFECCFMQNPMCAYLAKHHASKAAVTDHILQLAEQIQPLAPLLVYFYQQDIRASVERVSQERSKEWLDFVIWYHTQQGYGQAHGLQGFDGLIQFLQMRQELELEICERLPFEAVVIDNTERDWTTIQQTLEQNLRNRFEMHMFFPC